MRRLFRMSTRGLVRLTVTLMNDGQTEEEVEV